MDGHAGAILKAFRVGAELARASWEHEAGEGASYSVDRALDGHRDLRSARFAKLGASQARRFAALLASHPRPPGAAPGGASSALA